MAWNWVCITKYLVCIWRVNKMKRLGDIIRFFILFETWISEQDIRICHAYAYAYAQSAFGSSINTDNGCISYTYFFLSHIQIHTMHLSLRLCKQFVGLLLNDCLFLWPSYRLAFIFCVLRVLIRLFPLQCNAMQCNTMQSTNVEDNSDLDGFGWKLADHMLDTER